VYAYNIEKKKKYKLRCHVDGKSDVKSHTNPKLYIVSKEKRKLRIQFSSTSSIQP
jgi:hypothetical protein